MLQQEDDNDEVCTIEAILEEQANELLVQDVLTRELVDSNEDPQELQKVSLLHGQWRIKVEVLPLLTGSEEHGRHRLDRKPLPIELKYAFFGGKMHCPVVISSLLSNPQKASLLQILHTNMKAIGWKISDLKGISPTACTHHIYLEKESKVVRQPQRRLNLHMEGMYRLQKAE